MNDFFSVLLAIFPIPSKFFWPRGKKNTIKTGGCCSNQLQWIGNKLLAKKAKLCQKLSNMIGM
jgi:hypothetical protein